MHLTSQQLRHLSRIMGKLPHMAAIGSRRSFLRGALLDVPRADAVLGTLDLEGATSLVSDAVVLHFLDAGQITREHTALELLIRALLDRTTDLSDQAFLRARLQSALMSPPPVSSGQLPDALWQGADDPSDLDSVREKVIGENMLRHVYVLHLGVAASAAVCQVKSPLGTGTGFLIAPGLVMTNHHVIGEGHQVSQCSFRFRYELDERGEEKEVYLAQGQLDGLFMTDPDLDLTIVTLAPCHIERLSSLTRPLAFRAQLMKPGDRVAIIQHPGGLYKQIAFQDSKVQYADTRIVQYTTTTLPGSSGAPVFNELFEVVAIHTCGGYLQQPDDSLYYYRNQGTSAIAILDAIKQIHPDSYAKITVL